jgi:hypothetical protein
MPFAQQRERRVSWIWYWTVLDRESDGFIASVPDLGDLVAYGATEKEAVAHVGARCRPCAGNVESGQPAPRARKAAELPSAIRSKEVGRCLIPVEGDLQAREPAVGIALGSH